MTNLITKELSKKSSVSFLNIKIFMQTKTSKKITKIINKMMVTLHYNKKLLEEKKPKEVDE